MSEQLKNHDEQLPSISAETSRVHSELAKVYRGIHGDPIHADYLETIPGIADLYDQGLADEPIAELTGEDAKAVAESKAKIDRWEANRSSVQGLIQKGEFAAVPTLFYPRQKAESAEQFAHRNYDFAIHQIASSKTDVMVKVGLVPTYKEFRDSREFEV